MLIPIDFKIITMYLLVRIYRYWCAILIYLNLPVRQIKLFLKIFRSLPIFNGYSGYIQYQKQHTSDKQNKSHTYTLKKCQKIRKK